jgi:Rap1a immunity proteins
MRLRMLVLAAGLLWPASGSSQQGRFFATGNDLFRFCSAGVATSQSICNGYVAGVVDTLGVFDAIGVTKITCVEPNVSNEQVKQVVVQYLTAHPETRHLGAAGEVVQALQKAFPCTEQAH